MAPPHIRHNSQHTVTRLRSGYRCSVVRVRLLDKKKAATSSASALAVGTAVMFSTDGLAAVESPIHPIGVPVFGQEVDVLFFMLMILLMAIALLTVVLALRGNQLGRK